MQVIIYLFLIERVHVVRGGHRTHLQDKLYLFNMLGLVPYCVIVVLAIVYRVNELNEAGQCYIGLARQSSFPLLIYDLIVNVTPFKRGLTVDISDPAILATDIGIIFVWFHTKHTSSKSRNSNIRYSTLMSLLIHSRHNSNITIKYRKHKRSIRPQRPRTSLRTLPILPSNTRSVSHAVPQT